MRDYATVSPRFWCGTTGKAIRAAGRDAQLVALYLLTCPNSNMAGLYYLPLPVLCHETGIPFEGASEALRRVAEAGFATYDHSSEVVFVHEMARFQVAEELKATDNRIKGVEKLIAPYRKCRLYNEFLAKYADKFHLKSGPENGELGKPLRSPFEAPSKPGTGTGTGTGEEKIVPNTEQVGDSEQPSAAPRKKPRAKPAPPEPSEDDPAVLWFPTKGEPNKWPLLKSELTKYQDAFHGLDVMAEFRKAQLWCETNPGRRKTSGGMRAFLTRWLSKGNDSGRGRFSADGRMAAPPPTAEELDRRHRESQRRIAQKNGELIE